MSENKSNVGYFPSEGETLIGYTERLRTLAMQYEGWMQNHIKWFTHYGAGACSICDIQNINRYAIDILVDIANELKTKNIKMIAHRPKGATSMDYFEFKLQGRR